MKILDIRGNLLKIESSKPVNISTLIKITDGENIYIAQVLYAESNHLANYVFAKLVAYFDAPFLPVNIQNISKDALCEEIKFSSVVNKLGNSTDVVSGELAYEDYMLPADKSFFDKRILMVSENIAATNLLVSNFAHQIKHLGYNTIVFDTDGSFDGVRLIAGIDFKLPLNSHAIEFIYDKYFSDITEESKSVIKSIFDELKSYASTVPYIPFKSFKSVIDSVLDYSNNLSLYFFKNKLEKLYEADIFANTHDEVMDWTSLSEFGPGTIVIDLSKVSHLFVSEYISLVLNSFKGSDIKLYSFIKLFDSLVDKEFIKEVIENENVITSCVVSSNFKYLSVLKQNCESIIVFAGVKKSDSFDYCKFILKNLPVGYYVLTGNLSAPYSIIYRLKEINEVIPKVEDITKKSDAYDTKDALGSNNSDDIEPLSEANNSSEYEPVPYEQDEDSISEEIIQDYIPENSQVAEVNSDSDVTSDNNLQELKPVEEISDLEQPIEGSIEELQEHNIELNNEPSSVELVSEDNSTIPEVNYDKPLDELAIEPVNEDNLLSQEQILDERMDKVEQPSEITDNDIAENSVDDLELQSATNNNELDIPEDEFLLEDEAVEPILEEASTDLNELDEQNVLDEIGVTADEKSEAVVPVIEESSKTQEELLDEEIRRDVDKMYTAVPQEESESLSEDDLDFIEELVGTDDLVLEEEDDDENNLNNFVDSDAIDVIDDAEVSAQSELLPEEENESDIKQEPDDIIIPKRNTATPAVPIYSAEIPEDAMVHSDPIQQGDRVMHVKFGVGVVEKIFSYGTKNFCSINFENIGRKVLDPNITELKKV